MIKMLFRNKGFIYITKKKIEWQLKIYDDCVIFFEALIFKHGKYETGFNF